MEDVGPEPTAIDLFAGAGGLTRGLIQAGFRVLGAIEQDPLAVESYRGNFKQVRLWDTDIREVHITEIRRVLTLKRGELDLLAGCPPCEGFSTMRTLNGAVTPSEPMNDLVLQFVRFIRGLLPRMVMIENVPALAKDDRLADVKAAMNQLGYRIRVDVVNAADYGVPQRRRRMLLLASRLGELPTVPTHPHATVKSALADLPDPSQSPDPLHNHGERRSPVVTQIIAEIPVNGGSRSARPKVSQLACHQDFDGFKDVYGRMAWDTVSPTITGGCTNPSKGRFLHPEQNRAITLREAARLQSFPDDHYFSMERGKYAAAELIGNALPPLLVKHQATALANHLRQHRACPGPKIGALGWT
jgi:DNA (cytosine-5)-methyltransferase 1